MKTIGSTSTELVKPKTEGTNKMSDCIFEINTEELRDVETLKAVIDKYGDSDGPFLGTNSMGQDIRISVNKDNVTIETWTNMNGQDALQQESFWLDGMNETKYVTD